jgi:predicted nucleic acid-binding protein
VVLRIVLRQRDPLREWQEIETGITSELTLIECSRVLDRLRLSGASVLEIAASYREVEDILNRLDIVRFNREVTSRALSPLPVKLGTLDAIHLASARVFRDRQSQNEPSVIFATHDNELAAAARATNFPTLGA